MWRHIFDSKFGGKATHMNAVAQTAWDNGYKFFCFNGKIYFIERGITFHDTGLTADDVK